MEVSGGEEEGFIMEWTPCSHMLNLIPARVQTGLFSSELCLTCIDAVSDYIALGTNIGLVYWYDRKKGNIQRLRCENSSSPITFVKIVNTVDYMVGAGNAAGQVTVFQIPKEHPENIPDNFKPKVEPKVERYTIGNLHKSQITSIEWSKNGMRLFSGDKNGVIIMTEIDFYMHLCKSSEIVNEEHEIVQLSWCQNTLLVSSVYRSIVCERDDARWRVRQVGKRERKSLCRLGAVFQYSYARGGEPAAYVARPGQRLWRADKTGEVLQTLLFKDAIANPLSVVELLNPAVQQSPAAAEAALSALHVFREQFLLAHDDRALFVLDPRSLTAAARLDSLRRILSVSVNKDEVFVLEGPRSVVRLGRAPEPAALHADDPMNLMSKSLSSSIQHAVNTVRDLTHIDHTVPFITSVLEQPISMLTKNEFIDTATVAKAEECFELPPIKPIPSDLSNEVLESIINEFRDVSAETEALRRAKAEELEKKLKIYNSIMEKKCDAELIHSSRRSRRREGAGGGGGGGSGGGTPRHVTPVRRDVSYTTPTLMDVSVYSNVPQEADDILEKQIEEKEKILAKMLNLESLSIKTTIINTNTETETQVVEGPPVKLYKETHSEPANDKNKPTKMVKTDDVKKELVTKPANPISSKPIELVPKLVKLPNNWNLGDIELKLELPTNGVKETIVSPDEQIEKDWEFV